jgi:hypothetical protein
MAGRASAKNFQKSSFFVSGKQKRAIFAIFSFHCKDVAGPHVGPSQRT